MKSLRRRKILITLSLVGLVTLISTAIYLFYQSNHIPRTITIDCPHRLNAPVIRISLSNSMGIGNFSSKETYLRPTNTLFPELSADMVTTETKSKIEDIIKTGSNLKPYVTELGEAAWIENGIVYRPWRKPDPKTMHKTHPSPYFTEYESYVPFDEKRFFEGSKHDLPPDTKKKVILWHTPTRYTPPSPYPQPLKACPEFPCLVTTNSKYTQESSAMIFASQIMESDPPPRRPDQVFVFHNHEPPFQNLVWTTKFQEPQWNHLFNWTMTYRMDSDFVVPYGIVRKRPTPIKGKNYTAIVARKTKTAAWIVSNCRSSAQRNQYVKQLRKYINVDIYGKCGNLECPHEEDDKCAELIASTYKFYISFESSLCVDYITEKLFHYLTMDTIVVARGSDQYFQHAPSDIFLNAADFPSPKQLADKIKSLDKDNDAYISMLKEKDKYMSLVEGYPVRKDDGSIRFMAYRFESVPLCHMCQRLWNLRKYAKKIPRIDYWFSQKMCHRPCHSG